MAKASREFRVFAKPAGSICNLDCHYCYYLKNEQLYFFKFLHFPFHLFNVLRNYLKLILLAHLVDFQLIYPYILQSWYNLIALYEAWNKPEKAKEWRSKLEQIEDFEE